MSTVTLGAAARPLADMPTLLRPATSLRLEGLLLLTGAVALFAGTGESWWVFGLLFLVPDVGLLGYLAGSRIGAHAYNATHGLALPLALAIAAHLAGGGPALAGALVWIAHIGFDRALGYGLKYPADFHDTHLQRVA